MDSFVISENWRRPKIIQPPDCKKDPIVFQQIQIDHYVGPKREGFLGLESSLVPVTRMFGVTLSGNSILCHVHGYHPYFYVCTAKKPNLAQLEVFRQMLDDRSRAQGGCQLTPLPQMVVRVEYVPSKTIYKIGENDENNDVSYNSMSGQHLLKIVVVIPQAMKAVQSVFTKGQADSMGVYFINDPEEKIQQIYEAKIDHDIRFMCDLDIHGCSWIELPSGKYKLREQLDFTSHCQLECDIDYTDFVAHLPEGDWTDLAPVRTLSFDIECKLRGFMFPQAEKDAVIQISNVVFNQSVREPFIKCIFTLRSCAPVAGAEVRSFEDESEMLLAWSKFVTEVDPDIMTGYNVRVFDFRYLFKRAKALGLQKFSIGRICAHRTEAGDIVQQLQNSGKSVNLDVNVEGRVQFDLYVALKRDYRLQSYKLNAVSEHFLKEQKDDVHFTQITKLFNGDEHSRRKLAEYCLKDSVLVMRLLAKLKILFNYIETARTTGVPLGHLLNLDREQLKTISKNLRQAKKSNQVLPDMVLKKEGLYDSPQKTQEPARKRVRVV